MSLATPSNWIVPPGGCCVSLSVISLLHTSCLYHTKVSLALLLQPVVRVAPPPPSGWRRRRVAVHPLCWKGLRGLSSDMQQVRTTKGIFLHMPRQRLCEWAVKWYTQVRTTEDIFLHKICQHRHWMNNSNETRHVQCSLVEPAHFPPSSFAFHPHWCGWNVIVTMKNRLVTWNYPLCGQWS